MSIAKIFIVLPCHSLEDLPTHYRGNLADGLLANWTFAWHPRLISLAGCQPATRSAEFPGDFEDNSMIFVPEVAQNQLHSDFDNRSENSFVCRGFSNRKALCKQANQLLNSTPPLEDEEFGLVGDFYALGFGVLQVQLMTRQLRGSTTLDQNLLETQVVAAANAHSDGDMEVAREKLQSCFDLLMEERNAYYPVQPELIDLVLLADTTLGKSLTAELDSESNTKSFLATGAVLRQLSENRPTNSAALKARIESERADLVGGLENELWDPLISVEATLNQIRSATATYQEQYSNEASVFARRTFGMTPAIPGLLEQFNFLGALHCSMDGGSFPTASSSNVRWEAEDGSSVMALAQATEDANEGFTFLRLSTFIGQALDSAHTATVLLAHWPNRTHFAFEDMKRINQYGPLFGRFTMLSEYFEHVYDPGYGDTFTADEYRGFYLKSALAREIRNPISRYVDYWRQTYRLRSLQVLLVQLATLDRERAYELADVVARIEPLQSRIEVATVSNQANPDELSSELKQIDDQLEQIKQQLCKHDWGGSNQEGIQNFIANLTSFQRTVHSTFESAEMEIKTVDDSTDANTHGFAEEGGLTELVAGVAPVSFQMASALKPTKTTKKSPAMIVDDTLRNRFFQVSIDTATGGIRSIDKYDRRNNLLSQQLAIRIPDESKQAAATRSNATYSRMICDEICERRESAVSASITSRGRLVSDQNGTPTDLAEYSQQVRVVRGMPIIEVNVDLKPLVEFSSNPNHYLCSRLAWKYESTDLVRSAQEFQNPVAEEWVDAPNFVRLSAPNDTLTLLTNGLPYHRRSARRMLDSVLMVAGESRSTFRFGIGLNLSYPLQSSIGFMSDPFMAALPENKVTKNGWLFHFNCKNIVTTWWRPLLDESRGFCGVEIRMLETEKRSGQLTIRCPFEIAEARRVNFFGDHLRDLEVEENKTTVEFHGSEFFQVQLNWKP